MQPPAPNRLEVWIDGDCDICRRSERWCSDRDPRRRLNFVDLHDASREDRPGAPDTMMETVHIRLPDGTVRTGFDAWRRILIEVEGWRWLARLAGLPGVRHLGRSIYPIVARHRQRLSFKRL